MFVHVTEDPAVIVTEFGEKAKFWIVTLVASWAAAGLPKGKSAANASTTASALAAPNKPKRVVRIRIVDPSMTKAGAGRDRSGTIVSAPVVSLRG
jgi:hypothetical protein